MISLCLSLLAITSISLPLTTANSNVTGNWTLDWQNVYVDSGTYNNLTITETNETSKNLTATWGTTNTTVIKMSFVSTNVWVDNSNQQLVYDPTTDTLTYYLHNADYPYLYSRTGFFISRQDILGSISGMWINPTPVNASTNMRVCCAPTAMTFPINMADGPQVLTTFIMARTSNCSSPLPSSLNEIYFAAPSTETLVWSDQQGTGTGQFQISLTPADSLNQLRLVVNTSFVCEFYLYRSNETENLNGTWLKDWQTRDPSFKVETYQVTTVNSQNISYMMALATLQDGTQNLGYISQMSDQSYWEFSPALMVNSFDHDTYYHTNTLFDSVGRYFLLSPNGSAHPSAPFINTWYTPSDEFTSCCVPSSLTISGPEDTPTLNVTYNFPEDYLSGDVCTGLIQDVNVTTLESTISILLPNFYQLNFTDSQYQSSFALGKVNTSPALYVENLFGQSNCQVFMTVKSPTPLGSDVLLTRIVLLVFGIFVFVM